MEVPAEVGEDTQCESCEHFFSTHMKENGARLNEYGSALVLSDKCDCYAVGFEFEGVIYPFVTPPPKPELLPCTSCKHSITSHTGDRYGETKFNCEAKECGCKNYRRPK